MEFKFNVLTWIFTIFVIIVIIIRIGGCIEGYENDEDDEIIIEDRTPQLSDSEYTQVWPVIDPCFIKGADRHLAQELRQGDEGEYKKLLAIFFI